MPICFGNPAPLLFLLGLHLDFLIPTLTGKLWVGNGDHTTQLGQLPLWLEPDKKKGTAPAYSEFYDCGCLTV